MDEKNFTLDKQLVAQAFAAAAPTYDQAALIEQEIGSRLLAKLADLNVNPQHLLDLGCGTGYFTAQLQETFPHAQIISIDFALGMLNFANNKRPAKYCGADAMALPFANKQFDLIFANCCLPWIDDLPNLFRELQRVLTANGLILFATFGPDSLQELGLTHRWPDMHILGDLLLQQAFHNPVLDVEYLTFQYANLATLCKDLQNTGSFIIDLDQVTNLDQPFQCTIEAIYGMVWAAKAKQQHRDESGNIYIPIEAITYL